MGDAPPPAPSEKWPAPSPNRRLLLSVFLTLLGLHTFCLGKELGYTEDAMPILQHVEMVVRHGAWTTPVNPDGEYSMYGIGMTLWHLPFRVVLGGLIADAVPPETEAFYLRQAYIFLNVLATAGTGVVLCAWALGLGLSRSGSVLAALAVCLATLSFPYARYDFSEPTAGFFLVAGVYFLWLHRESRMTTHLFYAGTLLACGALTRIAIGLAVVVMLPFVWTALDPRHQLKGAAVFLAPLAAAVGIIGVYNYGRFGNPFETGYPIDFESPLLEGLTGLLFSWGRGAVLYTPVSVLGFIILFLTLSSERWLKGVIGLLLFFFLVLHAKWSYWYGGWSWGPRLLLPVLPFAGLGLAVLFSSSTQRRIWITLVFGVGGLINFLAVFVPFTTFYQTALANGFREEWLLWRQRYCPLLTHHDLLTQILLEDYDFIWLGGSRWGWPAVAIGLAGAGVATIGLRGLVSLARSRDPEAVSIAGSGK